MGNRIRVLAMFAFIIFAILRSEVTAQQPYEPPMPPGIEYIVWFSYSEKGYSQPGTNFKTEAEAQAVARQMDAQRGSRGERLYFNVKVVPTPRITIGDAFKLATPGDNSSQYKKGIVDTRKRVTNAKTELTQSTQQLSVRKFNDVNKLVADFNRQYDDGVTQGWSSEFGQMGIGRVDPVNAEGSRDYTVLVYQQQGGRWVKDDSRSIVSNDLESVQGYVVQVKSIRGWTATTNAPEKRPTDPTLAADLAAFHADFQKYLAFADARASEYENYQNNWRCSNGQGLFSCQCGEAEPVKRYLLSEINKSRGISASLDRREEELNKRQARLDAWKPK